ncbi:sel1 repeat family protein [Helicobacter canis]|uniref:Beta-lactamase n=1 Tax=Helicobacter canis TaxID=29419 RepID=A0A377J475_9HELI|nr:sel1 repeat family protein [Helicobacter canis]STO97178.1 Uncharacterised protein [Helicobacter canis]
MIRLLVCLCGFVGALCTLSMANAPATLEHFVPLVLESKQSKVDATHNAKPQATLPPLSKTPQVRLWDLSAQYVEQFSPAIAHLRKLATTQEQKDFIKAYEVFFRVALLRFATEYVRDNDGLTAFLDTDSITESKVIKPKEEHARKKIELAWESFLAEQNAFILSFGGEFFHFLSSYKPTKVCVSGGCGHETELFNLANTFRSLQSKDLQLQEVLRYGTQGFALFALVASIQDSGELFKDLGFDGLRAYPSKELEPLIKELQGFEDNAWLGAFVGYFAHEYLSRLYRAKYLLRIYTQKSKTKQILESMAQDGLAPCLDSTILPKQAQKLCEQSAHIAQSDLPDMVMGNRVFFLQDRQNCLELYYEQDKAHLRLIPSLTSTSAICQTLQKSAQKLVQESLEESLQDSAPPAPTPIDSALSPKQQAILERIQSPSFALDLQDFSKLSNEKISELCKKGSIKACQITATRTKDLSLLLANCKAGVGESCAMFSELVLSGQSGGKSKEKDTSKDKAKGSKVGIAKVLEASKRGCELGDSGSCAMLGELLALKQEQIKHFTSRGIDTSSITRDLAGSLPLLQKSCARGEELGCLGLIARAKEYEAAKLTSSAKELIASACAPLEYLLGGCDETRANKILEVQKTFMLKVIYKDSKLTKADLAQFEKVCKDGSNLVCRTLMRSYDKVYDSPKQYRDSLRAVAKLACARDDSESCAVLAGLESTKSKGSVEQAQLYKKACDLLEIERADYMDRLRLNSYASCSKAGDAFWLGKGAGKDRQKAQIYYYQACENGEDGACDKLRSTLAK